MAKKPTSSSTTKSAVSVQSADVAVNEQNVDVMDVNLAEQSTTEAPTEAPTVKPTSVPTEAPTVKPTSVPSEAPTSVPTVKPDVPVFDQEDTLSYKLKLATGVRYDLDKMVADCNGDKEALHRAYNKVSWHLGRIHSCADSSHITHQGRYDTEGNESSLLKEIKALFSEK